MQPSRSGVEPQRRDGDRGLRRARRLASGKHGRGRVWNGSFRLEQLARALVAERRSTCSEPASRRAVADERARRRGPRRRASWSQTDERGCSSSRADSSTARSSTSSSDSASRQPAAEVEERVRDLERGLGALGLEPLGLVEARVLERDGGVAAEHLEQADVVLVELVDAELGDDDGADHARAVAERDGDHRLVDVVRARDRHARSRSRARSSSRIDSPVSAARPVMPSPMRHVERLDALVRVRVEVAAPRDGDEVVAVDDVEAAAVVVDEHPQLVDDRRRRSRGRRSAG